MVNLNKQIHRIKKNTFIIALFSLLLCMAQYVMANESVKYNDIYEYDSKSKTDELRSTDPTSNKEQGKMDGDAAHQIGMNIQKQNEIKATEKSIEEKIKEMRNEVENKKKGYIRKAQRYVRRLNWMMALYYFHKASKIQTGQINLQHNIDNLNNYKEKLNAQKYDPNIIKNNATFNRDLSGSLARNANPDDLNRDQSTFNFSIEEKKFSAFESS